MASRFQFLVTSLAITIFCVALTHRVSAAEAAPALTVQELVTRAKPSIVVITFTGRENDRQGLGSGVIVSPDGLIATNLHVIGEARPISVQLSDGRKFDVTAVEATERHHDLALLRIDAKDLPALPLGNSDELKEGEAIVAIGNPLGLERSVVAGVLSGRREVEGRTMLQIAMPIERGNSGGPILDLHGRVHGLVTLKSLKTENLGFAAPVNQLKPLMERPNPIAMDKWLTIGVLDADLWKPLAGGRWRQRAGRIQADGRGNGLGGRCVCLSTAAVPEGSYEVAVTVKYTPADGAAGLVFAANGEDRHYGFYPSNGELRLSRFDGPDVYAWTVLQQVRSPHLKKDDWNLIKVRVEPDAIKCFLNGELVIESRDANLRGGKVGLCKFRQTEAEFKDFRVGEKLESVMPPAELTAQLADAVRQIPDRGDADDALLTRFNAAGPLAQSLLEEQARSLEQRARKLRRISVQVHEHRVRAEFQKLIEGRDEDIDLTRGALLIAAMDNPELDVNAYVQEVDRIAKRIRKTLSESATEIEKLAAMKKDLFEEQGFHGSRHDYDHRANSYLNEVLDDREGLPITLAVLFMEVAKRLDVNVAGIGLPRHFVVRHLPSGGPGAIIDAFERGQELSIDEAKAKVAALGEVRWDDQYLEPATRRSILVRMLRNLIGNASNAEDHERMLRYIELVLVLTPDSVQDRYFRSVLSLQTQRYQQARMDAEWLLEKEPEQFPREILEELNRTIAREAARVAE
ncbi:MAG TPA: transglutaminase family protein [Planctomycetaceae bacterium]|nr:transglutaminase family protein [Planctomycetaceae bacterium]